MIPRAELCNSVEHHATSRRCDSCSKIHIATILRFLCYIFFMRATQLLWIALGSQYSRPNPNWVMGSLACCAESDAFLNLWGLLSISVVVVKAANFAEFCLGWMYSYKTPAVCRPIWWELPVGRVCCGCLAIGEGSRHWAWWSTSAFRSGLYVRADHSAEYCYAGRCCR